MYLWEYGLAPGAGAAATGLCLNNHELAWGGVGPKMSHKNLTGMITMRGQQQIGQERLDNMGRFYFGQAFIMFKVHRSKERNPESTHLIAPY
jgi:hypothetical protein